MRLALFHLKGGLDPPQETDSTAEPSGSVLAGSRMPSRKKSASTKNIFRIVSIPLPSPGSVGSMASGIHQVGPPLVFVPVVHHYRKADHLSRCQIAEFRLLDLIPRSPPNRAE